MYIKGHTKERKKNIKKKTFSILRNAKTKGGKKEKRKNEKNKECARWAERKATEKEVNETG